MHLEDIILGKGTVVSFWEIKTCQEYNKQAAVSGASITWDGLHTSSTRKQTYWISKHLACKTKPSATLWRHFAAVGHTGRPVVKTACCGTWRAESGGWIRPPPYPSALWSPMIKEEFVLFIIRNVVLCCQDLSFYLLILVKCQQCWWPTPSALFNPSSFRCNNVV